MADTAGFHVPDLVFLLFSYDDKEILMRSLKKLFCFLLVVTFCMESGCGVKVPAAIETISEEAIYVNRAKSWFGDFSVDGDVVYITCHITLCNALQDRTIRLYGVFPDDEGILVTESVLPGFVTDELDSDDNSFLLTSGEHSFTVTFVGTYAGTQQKNDRLLPEILITEDAETG